MTQALGRSRGGFSTKIHLRVDRHGLPFAFVLSPGQSADQGALTALMEAVAIRRTAGGRPRQRPERVVADRAYSSQAIRTYLRRRGIGAVIPQPSSQKLCALVDWTAYRSRNAIERLINRLKQFRRIATRYEKLAANYLAMVHVAAIRIWLGV